MVKLDILSDPICPWCYIGKANLDRALESAPDHPLEIEWHPFQLNPDMPDEGMDRRAYLEWKFGGRDNAIKTYSQIAQHAEQMGLDISFEKITTTPNTMNAHRLIHWAGQEGRQTPVVSALFRAYFRDGRDIGDVDVLADIADENGLDRAMISQLLSGKSDIEDIKSRDEHARQRGVTGVPCFVVANQHVVSGAQPPELWKKVIEDILAESSARD